MRKGGKPFKDVVNCFLRLGLNARAQLKPANRFVVCARPLGERPGLNFNNIGEPDRTAGSPMI